MDEKFFWNTFVPDSEVNERYFRAPSRWSNFTPAEMVALTGMIRLTMHVFPDNVSRLNRQVRIALMTLFLELEEEARS